MFAWALYSVRIFSRGATRARRVGRPQRPLVALISPIDRSTRCGHRCRRSACGAYRRRRQSALAARLNEGSFLFDRTARTPAQDACPTRAKDKPPASTSGERSGRHESQQKQKTRQDERRARPGSTKPGAPTLPVMPDLPHACPDAGPLCPVP